MNKNKDLITIDLSILSPEKAGEITPEADIELKKIYDLKTLIDNTLEAVKDKLAVEMEKQGLKTVQSESFTISIKETGGKYQFDPSLPVNSAFVRTVSYGRLDAKAVASYLDKNKKLPKGVINAPRSRNIVIEPRDET